MTSVIQSFADDPKLGCIVDRSHEILERLVEIGIAPASSLSRPPSASTSSSSSSSSSFSSSSSHFAGFSSSSTSSSSGTSLLPTMSVSDAPNALAAHSSSANLPRTCKRTVTFDSATEIQESPQSPALPSLFPNVLVIQSSKAYEATQLTESSSLVCAAGSAPHPVAQTTRIQTRTFTHLANI